jgi:uncharacterized protein (TIGR02271 family)
MEPHPRIEPGASVEALDGQVGTVKSVIARPSTGEIWYLLIRDGDRLLTVPAETIAEVVSPHAVRLRVSRDEVRRRADGRTDASGLSDAGRRTEPVRVPIHEERLQVTVEPVDLGELRIQKTVEHHPEIVTRSVEREELEIERVPLDRLLDQPVEPYRNGEWLVVPVMQEVLVVTKQLVLTEEVRIRTRRVAEQQEVYEVLRREHVSVEDATVHGARGTVDARPVRDPDLDGPGA